MQRCAWRYGPFGRKLAAKHVLILSDSYEDSLVAFGSMCHNIETQSSNYHHTIIADRLFAAVG